MTSHNGHTGPEEPIQRLALRLVERRLDGLDFAAW